ncbi:hypothetical protein HETIRDRAFT_421719 [Heterobasidion irregulare TC 32-1]|uniref:Uncharacterized protein n=1 Tax=Heterobasidion irregulare (strain TC 32-1) TaxID=747525 RepID=W4JXI5_HETIT|nr:uncharacterized protein HETIRDRAFT_421719 [Heterobasidion irregulare TC 32-1]ETW77606.1 hypothetical protein HETIRDRAFT_421719 [Heterobasidion irregulare TC 32-1]
MPRVEYKHWCCKIYKVKFEDAKKVAQQCLNKCPVKIDSDAILGLITFCFFCPKNWPPPFYHGNFHEGHFLTPFASLSPNLNSVCPKKFRLGS